MAQQILNNGESYGVHRGKINANDAENAASAAAASDAAAAAAGAATAAANAAAAAQTAAAAASALAANAIQGAIPFNATTGVATKPDGTTFSPVSGVAPTSGYSTLTCTAGPGNLPTAVDGITSLALNDSLVWSGPLGVWTLVKSALAVEDLSNASTVQRVASTLSGVSYDGSSRVTGYTLNGVAYTVAYPSSTSITVTGGGRVKTLTLDSSGRFTGLAIA